MLVNVFRANGHTRVDQPAYVEKGLFLAAVPWDPDEELMSEALELFGFGSRNWVGGRGVFCAYDDNGDVELIAEVE